VIFHIAYAADWRQAQRDGAYTVSTRGRSLAEEGFLHASTERQVAGVAHAFYRGEPGLVLLVIDPDRLTSELRYEAVPGADEPFPHIYGPLNLDAVVEARPFTVEETA
jgi:glutathione S-transferase